MRVDRAGQSLTAASDANRDVRAQIATLRALTAEQKAHLAVQVDAIALLKVDVEEQQRTDRTMDVEIEKERQRASALEDEVELCKKEAASVAEARRLAAEERQRIIDADAPPVRKALNS